MIKLFLLSLILFSSINAMERPEGSIQDSANSSLKPPPLIAVQEKTATQIISENQHRPEFMSCVRWLEIERPDYSEKALESHSLFPLLKEGMQLADFEVDTLENFTHKYMETNMVKEQAQTLMPLRHNAMTAKYFVGDLVDLLQGKTTIQKLAETYLQDRLLGLIEYQAELMNRKATAIDMSQFKRVRLTSSHEDPHFDQVHSGFLRSYNTKNRIIRELLYVLKDQDATPLIYRLSPKLTALIKLSVSMHPFFNKETEQWLDYDIALEMAEARNLLGNAAVLEIDIHNYLRSNKITGVKIPKAGYRELNNIPMPNFLLEGKKEEKTAFPKKLIGKKRNKHKKQAEQTSIPKNTGSLPNKDEQAKSKSDSIEKSFPGIDLEELSTDMPITLQETQVNETVTPVLPSLHQDSSIQVLTSINTSLNDLSLTKKSLQTKAPSLFTEQREKLRNKHIDTIHDIFRTKGYVNLNSDKIIAAWEHILKDKGYHKENTGRSHQPLYATLSDGSRIILGLFRSTSYGPRYVHYIREAFNKIGYGSKWLEDQGYKLD